MGVGTTTKRFWKMGLPTTRDQAAGNLMGGQANAPRGPSETPQRSQRQTQSLDVSWPSRTHRRPWLY